MTGCCQIYIVLVYLVLDMSKHAAIMPGNVRKSSRLTERVALREAESSVQQREYTLNLVKALKKKASQCTLELKIVEEIKGQNRIFIMSGGIYELYRMALLAHFENQKINDQSPHDIQIKPVKDKQGMIVETQVRVFPKRPGKSHGHLKYTVNLYHTRSSLMVNGNEASSFTDDHKSAIGSMLNIQNLDTIDQGLHAIILKELDKIQFNPINSNPKCIKGTKTAITNADDTVSTRGAVSIHTHKVDTTTHLPIGDRIDLTGQNDSAYICNHCDNPSSEQVIECSVCFNWYHYTCEGISEADFEMHCMDEDSLYSCMSCLVGHSSQEQPTVDAGPGPDPDDLRLTILPAPNCMTSANMQCTSKRMTVDVANSETNPNTDLQPKAARITEMSEKVQSSGIHHSSSSTSSIDTCALKTQTEQSQLRHGNVNTHVQSRQAPIGLLQVSTKQRVPSDSMTIKAHTAMELTPQTDQAHAKQPSQLPPSCTPSPALALAPTEVQQSGKSDPTVPSTAVSTYTNDAGPPNNTILPSSFVPSSHPARQGALPGEPTTDISQKRKPAKKQVGSRAKKAETGEAASGAMTLGFPSLGRTDRVLEETNSVDALEQERTSINDQMLKSKEKLLSTKERKLKDLEKKLHMKEINMSDQLDQNEYSKTYILTIKHKVKELENTNRLLKMKMLQQEEAGIVGNEQNGLVTKPTQSNRTRNEPQASADLHTRVTQMELKFLEHRINTLEHNFQTN